MKRIKSTRIYYRLFSDMIILNDPDIKVLPEQEYLQQLVDLISNDRQRYCKQRKVLVQHNNCLVYDALILRDDCYVLDFYCLSAASVGKAIKEFKRRKRRY